MQDRLYNILIYCSVIPTPTGPMTLTEENRAITAAMWGGPKGDDDTPLLRRAAAQIGEYFAGSRTEFELPLQVNGSEFQQAVCDAMLAIPYGETVTYGDIAKQVNAPAQAVGQACGGNPIPLIIPCIACWVRMVWAGFPAMVVAWPESS